MTHAGGWLLVPLMFGVLCVGIGLLCEAAIGRRVAGPLVPAVGLAGFVVLAGLLTILDATAEFATPVCLLAALAGVGLRRPWKDPRLGSVAGWAAGCALVAFAVAAAPSLLSGQGSVLGYIKLDDTVIWLALIEHVMVHGRDLAGLPHSTYGRTVSEWIGQGYPIGAMTPVGVVARLTGQAYVNAYQPIITGYVAVLALGLFGCARELLRSPRQAALVGVLGPQASLMFGYIAWGAVKETCVAALLPALAGVRELPLLGLLGGAMMCVYGVGGVLFAAPPLALGLLIVVLRREWRPLPFAAGLGALVVGAIPAIDVYRTSSGQILRGGIAGDDLGKLHQPLEKLQGAGLWPDGDFRDAVAHHGLHVLIAVLGLALAAGAVALAVQRRAWELPVLLVTAIVGGGVAIDRGAPWIDAKVLAIASPMLLAAGAAGVLAVPVARWAIGAVIAGCAWSSFLIFRDVYVAPHNSLVEQRALGRALRGKGPTLVLNYEGYSTRYFLGPADDEGISELRYNLIPDLNGQSFPDYTTAEIDDVNTQAVLNYNAIVRRTTPVGSLPPSPYVPFRAGNFFESWLRDPTRPAPLAHLPLSDGILPANQIQCRQLNTLAATTGAKTIVAAPRENPVVTDLARATLPADWRAADGIRPRSDGTARIALTVPTSGSWRAWVGGQVLGQLTVRVDGTPLGSYRHQLDAAAGWLRFGALHLDAGRHVMTLRYARGSIFRAGRGSAAGQLVLGPVALSPQVAEPLQRVPVARVDRFCDGRTYDWFEALP